MAPKRAGRTEVERQRHVVVDKFGGDGADRRRLDFDYWNLQLVREDVAVGTVFLGDSITEYWSLEAYFSPADGLIVNRGIGSDTAANMLRRFDADVVQLRPRNVVILAGLNDISFALGRDSSDEDIVDEVAAILEKLIDASLTARITPVMCSLTPFTAGPERHARFKAVVPRINEKLKAICAAKGCPYVDYAGAMKDGDGDLRRELSGDGVHPHHAGYRLMADSLIAAAEANRLRL